ncbi:HNH endonuclease [Devosia sp. WQ 349K1]|uniref:HNH endonuclease n=1 Tax=Devosia sp. WQ 349K1 TaxID=2800329 RepID=UPI00349F964B
MIQVLKPRLSALPPKLKTTREIRDKRYSADATVRSWYHSARWQKLRDAVLVRDLYTCQQTGVLLIGAHPAPNSPVVDHVVPHRGDERLFWDVDNLQAVSKAYHDSDKRKMEMQL